jgi:predicted AAA+ superfamily ATPase
LFSGFNGAFTENYVAQELIAGLSSEGNPVRELYYWSYNHSAEVDFIVQYDEGIYPLEVKAGVSRRKTSLVVFGEKFKSRVLSRVTQMNFKKEEYLLNYPLYAISRFPRA